MKRNMYVLGCDSEYPTLSQHRPRNQLQKILQMDEIPKLWSHLIVWWMRGLILNVNECFGNLDIISMK